MFIQVFTGVDQYVLINVNHIVSIDSFLKGSVISLSTGETIETNEPQNEILKQISDHS